VIAALGNAAGCVVGSPLPLFDREAKYGTPIEAPTSEAMMSGFEAIY
jgi:hypothetical protein